MRQHHTCSDRKYEEREGAHEHHVKEIDMVIFEDRYQPEAGDQEPMCDPDAPGQSRARSRQTPGLQQQSPSQDSFSYVRSFSGRY